jgi:uncharacterized protein (TIGR02118 family)
MADVKLVVIYPRPKDVEAFEKVYTNEHVPLAVAKLGGKTKIVATKVLGSPQGVPPFYRIAEVYFPSMQVLEACAASDGGKEALAHAVKISSGGAPVFLVAEEEMFTFTILRMPRTRSTDENCGCHSVFHGSVRIGCGAGKPIDYVAPRSIYRPG